ncbi:hypothetical protein AMELA_G00270470 [Ameiurus melas]|uniref:Uncharacterized protein n=1 Tax=Ameiurus melas TaxID=219545 RepID=A0A7J5ZNM9_AMEME|nr:hypothetical protein AMELA_G00270470 [Ameiurus melas]
MGGQPASPQANMYKDEPHDFMEMPVILTHSTLLDLPDPSKCTTYRWSSHQLKNTAWRLIRMVPFEVLWKWFCF